MNIPIILSGGFDFDYAQELNQELSDGLNNGVYNQEFTSAQITALLLSTSRPVLRVGTVFFDTDLSKLRVIVTAADPVGATNGVTETITSA